MLFSPLNSSGIIVPPHEPWFPLLLNSELVLESSPLFIALCLAGGGLVAFLAYRRNSISSSDKWYEMPVSLLLGLRTLGVALLLFLLLGPLFRSIRRDVVKPQVVIAVDNSSSLLVAHSPQYLQDSVLDPLASLEARLREKYDVERFYFNSSTLQGTPDSFSGEVTDVGQYLNTLIDRYGGGNLGGVITFTDGIYNAGVAPTAIADAVGAPLYFIAGGDTTPQRDVALLEVQHNKIAYAGNQLPLKVRLSTYGFPDADVLLTVTEGGKVLAKRTVSIKDNEAYKEVDFSLEAASPGQKRYLVRATPLSGEITTANNTAVALVQVLESKRKVLLLASAPHPDVAALRSSIERNSFYETDVVILSLTKNPQLPAPIKSYNLLVAHGLPATNRAGASLLQQAEEGGLPVWYILSPSTDLRALAQESQLFSISSQSGGYNNVLPEKEGNFSLFSLPLGLPALLPTLPPLLVPFAEVKAGGNANLLFKQKIGSVSTPYPLWLFGASGVRKSSALLGSGLWLWYLNEYGNTSTTDVTDALVSNTVQYLSNVRDTRQLQASTSKPQYNTLEDVVVYGELYNATAQPVTDAEIGLTLLDEAGKELRYSFLPSGSGYNVSLGKLPEGLYTYTATTTLGGKPLSTSSTFSVEKLANEYLRTTADHNLLRRLAESTQGAVLQPSNIRALDELIGGGATLPSTIYSSTSYKELIEQKWYFFLVFLLLVSEWALRKYYSGG